MIKTSYTKNWLPYKSALKLQFINAGLTKAFDTNFCITFSTLFSIENLMNYKIAKGLYFVDDVKWLNDNSYMKNGLVDFSPRFTGTLGNTTIYGNTQWNINNSIYAYGLIPEKMHPNIADNWDEYSDHTLITREMKDLGQEFLKRFQIDIEPTTDLSNLIYSPLQCIVKFADGDGILSPSGKTNHGVEIIDDGDSLTYCEIKDSYWQEIKKYDRSKVFYLQNIFINSKHTTMDTQNFIATHEKKIIFEGTPGSKGRFGIIINGQNREITSDRAAQACLYAFVNARTLPFGITIQTDLFDSIPKGKNF
jgi:hypothetical protein